MNKLFLIGVVLLTASLNVHAEDINVKLSCKGTAWLGGKQFDVKDGYMDISNGTVKATGLVGANGVYQIHTATLREDHLPFVSQTNPLVSGSVNRVTGNAIILEMKKGAPEKGGQALFSGTCTKAKPLF